MLHLVGFKVWLLAGGDGRRRQAVHSFHSGTPGVLRVQSYAIRVDKCPSDLSKAYATSSGWPTSQWLCSVHRWHCNILEDWGRARDIAEESVPWGRPETKSQEVQVFQEGDQVPRPYGVRRRHLLWPQQDSNCVNLACANNCQRCPEVSWVHWLLPPFYQGLCQSG